MEHIQLFSVTEAITDGSFLTPFLLPIIRIFIFIFWQVPTCVNNTFIEEE